MAPIKVAIAGGTGNVGGHITRALLDPNLHPSSISRVIVLTRSASSDKAKELAALGAEIRQIADSGAINAADLDGVDVFVNAVSHVVSFDLIDQNAKAAIDAGVKVYIPTEFGVDHDTVPVPFILSTAKANHARQSRELAGGKVKVISIHTGHFLEDSLGPWFGFDTAGKVYTSVGPATVPFSATSKADIGRATVQIAILAANNPTSIPDKIRIFGDTKSYAELAEINGKESGEDINVVELDYEESKAALQPGGDPVAWIRVVNGSGGLDLSRGENHRELVNPGETRWKWKTFQDFAREVGGKPFSQVAA